MSNRRRAREVVIQILFQRDLNPDSDEDTQHRFLRARLRHDKPIILFAENLLSGINRNSTAIDAALQKTTQNWKLTRMAATDRSILRLAAFEILFFEETPGPVAINEAIELAKRYGTNQSSQFVNGILDRLFNSKSDPELTKTKSESEDCGDRGQTIETDKSPQ